MMHCGNLKLTEKEVDTKLHVADTEISVIRIDVFPPLICSLVLNYNVLSEL
jgi:hypothetical protein